MSKDRYRELCAARHDIPLFMQPYWLDAVVPDQSWEGLISTDSDGTVRGAWAVVPSQSNGLRRLASPPLTPYTGIWLHVDTALPVQKQAAIRQAVVAELVEQLPRVAIFEQKLHPSLQDWMPFYWKGYHQETRYTFQLDCRDVDSIYSQFSDSFRRNLRAAERQFEVQKTEDPEELFALIKQVFAIRQQNVPFTWEDLLHVYEVMQARGQCALYRSHDDRGVSSAVFMVWDDHTTYYLLGGRAGSNTKNSTNLLLWHAIRDAGARGHLFDFEGSMIRGVHTFFRSFGAQMQPYLFIYRYRGLGKLKYLRH